MADLESRVGRLEGSVERLVHIVDGNGKRGLYDEFMIFVAEQRAIRVAREEAEKERDLNEVNVQAERDRQEKRRWNRITAAIAIVGLLIALLTWRIEAKKTSEAIIPGIGQQTTPQNDATIPLLTKR